MLHLSTLLFVIGAVFLWFFGWAFVHQRSRNAALFSTMCLAVAVFVIGYGFELRAANFEQLRFFLKVEYFGAPFMTVFWFLFSYKFYYNRNASFRLTMVVMVVPILTLLFSVTNEYHHFLYSKVSYAVYDNFVQAKLERGPWYYFYSVYSYAMILYGSALFHRIWRKSEGKLKTQAFLMYTGTLWPVLINISYLFGFSPLGLDLTPFGLLILMICYALAIFKYGVMELQEIIKTTAFSNIADGILVIDEQQRLVDFNSAGAQVFSWLQLRNIGNNIESFNCGKEILDQTQPMFILQLACDGVDKEYEFRSSELKEKSHVLGTVFFFRDVTEQRRLLLKLNELACFDALSHVFNRRKLLEEAEKEAERAVRYYDGLSVLMIDIDHFKKVNDTYGHLAGDEVIYQVALQVKHRIRGIDIVGRYGGEEFVVILSNADQKSAYKIAESIRSGIEGLTVSYNGASIRVTVSVGITTVINDGHPLDIAVIISQADEAMYRAKESGRNKVCQ